MVSIVDMHRYKYKNWRQRGDGRKDASGGVEVLWAGLSKQKVLGSRRSATASGLLCRTLFIPYAFPPQLEEHLWSRSTVVLSTLGDGRIAFYQ